MTNFKTEFIHKQLTNMRARGVTALQRAMAKQFATGGLNQVLGCTNLTLAPTGSHMNKQVQVVLLNKRSKAL
jgi:hypothetical protein